jgi:radical SAM superfamily enzyme YgiQ (UPF0313 family)
MTSTVFKKAILVASAQVQYSRPSAALAFLSGVCDSVDLPHSIVDINIEILKKHGHDVWLAMHNLIENPWSQWPQHLQTLGDRLLDDLVDDMVQQQPDLIVITVLSYMQQIWTQQFLLHLRKKLPTVTVIAGGPGIVTAARHDPQHRDLSFGRWLIQEGLLDYFCMGEGEIVFAEFLKGQTQLPGLNNASGVDTWQPQLEDLDLFPYPSYKKMQLDNYRTPEGSTRIIITGSRGCVRKCTFCDIEYHWPKYRYRRGSAVANEILQHHLDIGIENFWFNDSLINGSLKNFRQMLQLLRQHKQDIPSMKNLSISGQFIIRPRGSHPESLYQEMQAAGITRLDTGIESGSEAVRDHMQKKFNNADIDWHMEMCEKYGIKNWVLLLIGYPTETQQDFEMTLDLMRRYQKYIVNETIMGINLVNTLVLLPNSPLSKMSEELMMEHDHLNYYKWISQKNPTLTLVERTHRWIRAAETAMDLGYALPPEIMYNLERQYEFSSEQEQELQQPRQSQNKSHRVIPIATEIYN